MDDGTLIAAAIEIMKREEARPLGALGLALLWVGERADRDQREAEYARRRQVPRMCDDPMCKRCYLLYQEQQEARREAEERP